MLQGRPVPAPPASERMNLYEHRCASSSRNFISAEGGNIHDCRTSIINHRTQQVLIVTTQTTRYSVTLQFNQLLQMAHFMTQKPPLFNTTFKGPLYIGNM